MEKIIVYLKLLRPKQWIKNFSVLMTPFMKLSTEYVALAFIVSKIQPLLLCLLSMICASSSIYIYNDICDVNQDRRHPKKSKRPIASRRISVKNAYLISFVLAITSVLIGFYIGRYAILFPLLYIVLMVVYTVYLKKIPYVDIATILVGFFIRVAFGAYVSETKVSLFFSVVFMSILSFIAFGKRYSEYINNIKAGSFSTRETLRRYNERLLRFVIYISIILASVCYMLWIIEDNKFYRTKLIFTMTFFLLLLIIARYMNLIKNGGAEHPEQIFFHNKTIVISSVLIVLFGIVNIVLLRQ